MIETLNITIKPLTHDPVITLTPRDGEGNPVLILFRRKNEHDTESIFLISVHRLSVTFARIGLRVLNALSISSGFT